MKAVGIICILLATMPLSFAASKEMIELQRDVAQLQDQVRNLQKTLDQLTVLAQQAIDAGNRNNRDLAVMQNNLGETTKNVRESVSAPLMGVGQKMDAMSEDFRNLRETVNEVNSRVGKLDSKVTDLQNAVTVISRPPATPPPGPETTTPWTTPPAGGSTTPPVATTGPPTPPPGLKSETLYSNAYRDYLGGNYDLSLQEFSDYIKYF